MKKLLLCLLLALAVPACAYSLEGETNSQGNIGLYSQSSGIKDVRYILGLFNVGMSIDSVKAKFGVPSSDLEDWIVYNNLDGSELSMLCRFNDNGLKDTILMWNYGVEEKEAAHDSFVLLLDELRLYCGREQDYLSDGFSTGENEATASWYPVFGGRVSLLISYSDVSNAYSIHLTCSGFNGVQVKTTVDIDLSGMDREELIALRNKINIILGESSNDGFVVPKGTYIVGEHIPEGEYRLEYVNEIASISIHLPDKVFGESHSFTEPGDVVGRSVMEAGKVVEVAHGSIRFIPFTGLDF